jgi:hypothetical protein
MHMCCHGHLERVWLFGRSFFCSSGRNLECLVVPILNWYVNCMLRISDVWLPCFKLVMHCMLLKAGQKSAREKRQIRLFVAGQARPSTKWTRGGYSINLQPPRKPPRILWLYRFLPEYYDCIDFSSNYSLMSLQLRSDQNLLENMWLKYDIQYNGGENGCRH